jgi:hypothetical protein
MFVISEADVSTIRAAFDRGGEFSAAVELRPVPRPRVRRRDTGLRPGHRRLEANGTASEGEAAAPTRHLIGRLDPSEKSVIESKNPIKNAAPIRDQGRKFRGNYDEQDPSSDPCMRSIGRWRQGRIVRMPPVILLSRRRRRTISRYYIQHPETAPHPLAPVPSELNLTRSGHGDLRTGNTARLTAGLSLTIWRTPCRCHAKPPGSRNGTRDGWNIVRRGHSPATAAEANHRRH